MIIAVNNAPEQGIQVKGVFFTQEGGIVSTNNYWQSCRAFFFTFYTEPPAPENIEAERLNGTHMNVSWTSIPLTVSNGFITTYTIIYEKLENKKRQTLSLIVPGKDSSVVIGGLDPASAYTILVGATTSSGPGEFSDKSTAQSEYS